MKHAELALVGKLTAVKPFTFAGHWVNELGSTMDLTIIGTSVTGKYVSAVSGGGGPTPPFDVIGSVTDDMISFTVNWGTAITSWTGHGVFDKAGNPQILTLWHMVVAIPSETDPAQQWRTLYAGADTFTH